jgi:hypothetical protein
MKFAVLENLDDNTDINRVWENITENTKSLSYRELRSLRTKAEEVII